MYSLTESKIYSNERKRIMKCTYSLIENKLYDEESSEHFTFGIAALNQTGETIDSISDISCDKAECEKLVELFNNENLSPVHFHDAVEDWLN